MATEKIAGYSVLPRGYKVVEGTKLVQKSKQRRKQYKTPKAARQKIAAAARRAKIPLLTGGALAIGTIPALQLFARGAWNAGGNQLVMNYTGFSTYDGSFRFRRLGKGLLPLLAIMLVNRTGILKPVNQKLAKMRIPLRLN